MNKPLPVRVAGSSDFPLMFFCHHSFVAACTRRLGNAARLLVPGPPLSTTLCEVPAVITRWENSLRFRWFETKDCQNIHLLCLAASNQRRCCCRCKAISFAISITSIFVHFCGLQWQSNNSVRTCFDRSRLDGSPGFRKWCFWAHGGSWQRRRCWCGTFAFCDAAHWSRAAVINIVSTCSAWSSWEVWLTEEYAQVHDHWCPYLMHLPRLWYNKSQFNGSQRPNIYIRIQANFFCLLPFCKMEVNSMSVGSAKVKTERNQNRACCTARNYFPECSRKTKQTRKHHDHNSHNRHK